MSKTNTVADLKKYCKRSQDYKKTLYNYKDCHTIEGLPLTHTLYPLSHILSPWRQGFAYVIQVDLELENLLPQPPQY